MSIEWIKYPQEPLYLISTARKQNWEKYIDGLILGELTQHEQAEYKELKHHNRLIFEFV